MLLYMKQSLRRRFNMHAHVFIIMICAFILPLLVCFIRDSMVYGMQQNGIARTNNSYYIIEGASPHHVEYFEDLEDFNVVYEDGTIYFQAAESFDKSRIEPRRTPDENGSINFTDSDRYNANGELFYNYEIMDICAIVSTNEGGTFIFPMDVTGMNTVDSSFWEVFNQYLVLIVVFALLGMLVLYVMYSIHIGNFCPEIATLRCMGASKKHIRHALLAELLAMFFTAGIIAFALACLLGYVMLEVFMRIDDINTNMIWVIYHINPVNVLIIFGTMLVFMLCMYAVKMRSVMRLSPQQLALYSKNNQKLKHHRKKLALKKSVVAAVSKVLSVRANKGFVQSVAIAVPAMAALILVLGYLGIVSVGAYIAPPYDIGVRGIGDYTIGESGFNKNDFDFFDNLEGVERLNYIQANGIGADSHFIEQRGVISEYMGVRIEFEPIDRRPFAEVYILPIDYLSEEYMTEEVENALLENPNAVVMSTTTAWAQYAVGDTVSVYKRKQTSEEVSVNPITATLSTQDFNEPVQVTVGALIDKPSLTLQTEMYVPQEIYEQLIDKSDSNTVEITLKDGVDHLQFAQMLRDELIGGEVGLMDSYFISDLRDIADKQYKQAIGWYIFTGVAALVVFMVVLIVLYVLLSEHMRGQRQNMTLMRVLGATGKNVRSFYLRQSGLATIIGLVLALGIGVLASGLWVASRARLGYVFTLGPPVIVVLCLIAVVMVLAMNLPIIKATSTKNLQKLNFAQEG